MDRINGESEYEFIKSSLNNFIEPFTLKTWPEDKEWPNLSKKIAAVIFFDDNYIKDADYLKKIINHSELKKCYVGYLSLFTNGKFNKDLNHPWVVYNSDCNNKIYKEFENDPNLDNEDAIAYCVNNGFVLDFHAKWLIWFSTPWEIAIAMFLDVKYAEKFASSINDIYFLDNVDLVEKYSMSPTFGDTRFMISKYEHLNFQPDINKAKH